MDMYLIYTSYLVSQIVIGVSFYIELRGTVLLTMTGPSVIEMPCMELTLVHFVFTSYTRLFPVTPPQLLSSLDL